MAKFPDDYDPEKETVREYIHRNLHAEMTKEADKWVQSVLYGENSGGPLRGLFDEQEN